MFAEATTGGPSRERHQPSGVQAEGEAGLAAHLDARPGPAGGRRGAALVVRRRHERSRCALRSASRIGATARTASRVLCETVSSRIRAAGTPSSRAFARRLSALSPGPGSPPVRISVGHVPGAHERGRGRGALVVRIARHDHDRVGRPRAGRPRSASARARRGAGARARPTSDRGGSERHRARRHAERSRHAAARRACGRWRASRGRAGSPPPRAPPRAASPRLPRAR